jgi:RNA polymerase-binding transcription factor DksA
VTHLINNDPVSIAVLEHAARRLNDQVTRGERHLLELESSLGEMLRDPETLQEDRDSLRALVEAVRSDVRHARRALSRFSDGTYGRCVSCGTNISPERLDAMPTVERCARCA